MNEPKDGGPAFPRIETEAAVDRDTRQEFSNTYSYGGMTLRDYFAAKALMGVFVGTEFDFEDAYVAKRCYQVADAMLKAREQ